ncbi:MAG: PAS domain S-box protein [Thermodesulfovibrionales bacterium]
MNGGARTDKGLKDRILREQLRLAFKQLPTMQIASFIVALVISYAVRDIVPHVNIFAWVLMVLAIVVSRIVLYYRFLKVRNEPFAGEHWEKIYLVLTLISGIIWGLSSVIIYPAGNLGLIALFLLVIASQSAATTVAHSSIRVGPAVWMVPALLPYVIRCTVEGGETGYTMSILILIYLVTIFRHSLNQNRTIATAISLQFENLELLEEVRKANDILQQDITERKQTEERLRASETSYRNLFDSITDGIFVHDEEGRILDVNKGVEDMYGYPRDFFIGKTPEPLGAPGMNDLIAAGDAIHHAFEGEPQQLDFWSMRANGEVFPKEVRLIPATYWGRRVVIAVARDITERKRAEEALRQNEEFIRSVLDNVDEGFLVVDRDYRILTANRAFCSWVDMPLDDIAGRHCYEVSHKNLRPCHESGENCATKHAFETGEPHMAVHKHEDAKGNLLYVETKAFPLKDVSGTVTSVIETIQNITERHLLKMEQLKTQKLEAIGTLAGGIAHDFNNLLQGVFGYMSLAKINLDNRDKAAGMIDQAEKALQMSVNLTGQLLTFSKGGKPVKRRLSLRSTIENSANFALSGSRSTCRIDIDSNLLSVEADEGQIGQVIQNIVLNANEAMSDGGTVEVSAGNVDISKGEKLSLPDGGMFIQITIKDKGTGIPEQYLSRIFDPYFTTKQRGSGLGLATTYSIIRNHGGLIEVTSELNKGSIFHIYLPAVEAEEEEETQASAPAAGRKGKILVMDDDEMVRSVAMKMIEALGHNVEGAEDGKSTIDKYNLARESGTPFDVVVLDLTVKGGMGGELALKKLREIDPDVKAIVSSGYADNLVEANYHSYGFAASLKKPYRIDTLQESLNALLRSS